MKVLHINYWDKMGGAAIAARRLHAAMISYGIDSKMLVVEKMDKDDNRIFSILSFKNKIILYIYAILSSRMLAKYRPYIGNFSLNIFGLSLHNHPLVKEADVVYIHWVNNSMINLKSISRILRKSKLVVWFVHDMYPLTGGCHHAFDCNRYTEKCGYCPLLKSNNFKDISYLQLYLKKKYIGKADNLLVVSPSNWLGECVRQSFLFGSQRQNVIPNLICDNEFKIIDKRIARSILNIPVDEKLIMFGADMGVSNPYKGWNYLVEAIKILKTKVSLVIFGGICTDKLSGPIREIYNMGKLYDTYSLNLLYSACDVFVIPSLAEAFGQTALEAIACGTPAVGFNVGGLPDIIHHKKNGYLAKYKDEKDLRDGIEWCLQFDDCNAFMQQCRVSAIELSSAEKNVELHRKMISNYYNDRF